MLRSFHAELQKAHRRHDLLLCLLVPLIMILWVGGLAPSDPGELANGYSALFYSIPVIEAILMPVLMAVLASRLWEIEVKGSMPKLLYNLQARRSRFIIGKNGQTCPKTRKVWSKKLVFVYKCKKSEKNFEKRLAKPS